MRTPSSDSFAFDWRMYLPNCFRESIAHGAFREGDTIYDTPLAYEGTWSDALRHINVAFQISSTTADIVTFHILRPNRDRTQLLPDEKRTLKMDQLIELLRAGV